MYNIFGRLGSNIYISNDNKIRYLDMLQNYLKEDINTHDIKIKDTNEFDKFSEDVQQNFVKMERTLKRELKKELKRELIRKSSLSLGMITSIILAILSAISVFVTYINSSDIGSNKYEIYSEFGIKLVAIVCLCFMVEPIIKKLVKAFFDQTDK